MIVNSMILGSLIACAVTIVLRFLPRRILNAATRYAFWWMTLGIVIALPFLRVPSLSIPHHGAASPMTTRYVPPMTDLVSAGRSPEEDTLSISAAVPVRRPIIAVPAAQNWWPHALLWACGVLAGIMLLRLTASCYSSSEPNHGRYLPMPRNHFVWNAGWRFADRAGRISSSRSRRPSPVQLRLDRFVRRFWCHRRSSWTLAMRKSIRRVSMRRRTSPDATIMPCCCNGWWRQCCHGIRECAGLRGRLTRSGRLRAMTLSWRLCASHDLMRRA